MLFWLSKKKHALRLNEILNEGGITFLCVVKYDTIIVKVMLCNVFQSELHYQLEERNELTIHN